MGGPLPGTTVRRAPLTPWIGSPTEAVAIGLRPEAEAGSARGDSIAARPEQASRTPERRRSLSDSDTGPAPQSIPFASRVRYLVALGACRRRTALGPRLLAAGPASNSILLSIESNASEFRYSFRRAAIVHGAARHGARRPADGNAYVHRQSEEARPADGRCRKKGTLARRTVLLSETLKQAGATSGGIEADCVVLESKL